MNIDIAKERYKEVLRVDVITNTQGDFLATHVPFKKLFVTRQADLTNNDKKHPLTEKEVYDKLITPRDDDQFVLVKGDSGAGKSHLIRWFQAMLMANKPDSEAVLFVRRNDNTLKGTIKQLLQMDEVKNLPDSQMYKKLVNAGASVPENELKANIFYYYVSKIESDDGKGDNVKDIKEEERIRFFGRGDRSHIIALFNNEVFKEMMFAEDGPIDRIYSRFAERDSLDEDDNRVAGFIPDDFIIDKSFVDDLIRHGADLKARKFAEKLYGDTDDKVKTMLADYLNTFNESVIRRCTGLEAGDLNEVFADIRRELFKQGKNLTIFIEDVTSFTGVNTELLDALMTSHTGVYSEAGMCRLNAVVGATEGYYKDNFRDNFKVRVSNYITVPNDVFDGNEEGLYEFFARYLNTLSLSGSVVNRWVKNNNASQETYPVHEVKQGKEWDYFELADHKQLNLFPFNKRAISFLYRSQPSNQRTPRMLMRNIIEPHLTDVFDHIEEFPTMVNRVPLHGIDSNLINIFFSRQDIDESEKTRLSYFMSVWGDATNNVVNRSDGVKTIAEIPETIYKIFNLPLIEGKVVAESQLEEKSKAKSKLDEHSESNKKKNDDDENKIREALDVIDAWRASPANTLRVNSTAGVVGLFNEARNEINNFVKGSIDWLSEGISIDTYARFEDFNKTFVGFERQFPKGTNIVQLGANLESRKILEGFIRYNVEGKKSWNFPESNDYLLTIAIWLENVKPVILKAMHTYEDAQTHENIETDYMSYGMAADLYRTILNGHCKDCRDVRQLKPEVLFKLELDPDSQNAHCKEWNDLVRAVNTEDGKDNHQSVLQYYNLPQGNVKNSRNYVIDYQQYVKRFNAVIATGLKFKKSDLQMLDPVRQRRLTSELLNKIIANAGKAVRSEKELIKSKVDTVSRYFDISAVDDIELAGFIKKAKKFYTEANDNQLPVNTSFGKTNEGAINELNGKDEEIKKAIKYAQAALNAEDDVEAMMLMSRDPLLALNGFVKAVTALEDDIKRVREQMKLSLSGGETTDSDLANDDYKKEKDKLEECRKILAEVRGA